MREKAANSRVGAWDNEPIPITDPDHPTGIGLDQDGHLVIGWGGPDDVIVVRLSAMQQPGDVAELVALLGRLGLRGASARKLDFLGDLLRRRI